MPLLTTDRALLRGYKEGDREALAQVYRHYAPALAEFLRRGFAISGESSLGTFRGLRSAFELENAMQEIFIRAFSERARLAYDGLRPFTNYLFAIAKNYVIDELRRVETRRVRPLEDEDDDRLLALRADDQSNPQEALEAGEVEKLIAGFLERCDDKLRRYYELRCEQALTQEETAEKLSLTRIQVRRIEARFRRELLAYLKSSGYLAAYEAAPIALLGKSGIKALVVLMLLGGGHGM